MAQDHTRKQNAYALFRCTKSNTKVNCIDNNNNNSITIMSMKKKTWNHGSIHVRHKNFIETEASCRKQKLSIFYTCHVQLIEPMCNIYGVLYKNFVECPGFSKKSFDAEFYFFIYYLWIFKIILIIFFTAM